MLIGQWRMSDKSLANKQVVSQPNQNSDGEKCSSLSLKLCPSFMDIMYIDLQAGWSYYFKVWAELDSCAAVPV